MRMKKIFLFIPVLAIIFVQRGVCAQVSTVLSNQEQSTTKSNSAVAADTTKVEGKDLLNFMLSDTTFQSKSTAALRLSGSDIAYVSVEKPKEPEPVSEDEGVSAVRRDSLSVDSNKPFRPYPIKPYKSVTIWGGGRDRYGAFTEECAAHANGRLKRFGILSVGHAYQILAQFPSVVNGYSHVKIPNINKMDWSSRVKAVLAAHRAAADYIKEHFDIYSLIPGEIYVVNMYYSTSPHMLEFFVAAKYQGTGNYGTHVGVLYYDKKAETWIVEHNIHGHVHKDSLQSVLGGKSNPRKYGVTSISRASK